MKHSGLRAIPSVDKLAIALGDTGLPHPTVVATIRRELAALRKHGTIPGFEEVLSQLRTALGTLRASRLQPVINGTGILVHTNFGRAPLGHAVMEAVSGIGSQYNNIEYGISEGGRGGRAAYLEHNLALLCGSEAATVVNNNASALVLILRHFCKDETRVTNGERRSTLHRDPPPKNQVVISRGELVQIGGGFRISEILEASGARLCEVGTTNKTSLSYFLRAVTRETAPAEVLRDGLSLVCFSGDKLFGGPQAGIIVGRAKLVAALKREPLFRALRCDKLILAALEATVEIYLRNSTDHPNANDPHNPASNNEIPLLAMLHTSNDEL